MSNKEQRAFNHGVVCSAVLVIKSFGNDTIAREILDSAGLKSVSDLKKCGAGSYDVRALLPCLRATKEPYGGAQS